MKSFCSAGALLVFFFTASVEAQVMTTRARLTDDSAAQAWVQKQSLTLDVPAGGGVMTFRGERYDSHNKRYVFGGKTLVYQHLYYDSRAKKWKTYPDHRRYALWLYPDPVAYQDGYPWYRIEYIYPPDGAKVTHYLLWKF